MSDDWDEGIADSVDDEIWDALTLVEKEMMHQRTNEKEQVGAIEILPLCSEAGYVSFLREVYQLPETKIQETIQKVKRLVKLKAFQ